MTNHTDARAALPDEDILKRVTAINGLFEAWSSSTNQGYNLDREDGALLATYKDLKTEHAWRGYCHAALAQQAPAQPVAWRLRDDEASKHYGQDVFVYFSANEFKETPSKQKLLALLEPLYTAPPAQAHQPLTQWPPVPLGRVPEQAQQAAGVPEGWKLVPIKPTGDMIDEGNQSRLYREHGGLHEPGVLSARTYNTKQAWAAMLAAAPTAPAQVPEDARLLDAVRDNSWKLDPFDMPTGGGDADIGWRVVQYHMGEPTERVVAEAYEDDPRAAIRAAMAATQGKEQA